MARLIDADVIKAKLMEYIGLTNGFDRAFNETPTIDAVSVVRCKDCRHWSGCKSTMHNNHLCGRAKEQNVDYWTRADDFCSYGERKGE